ncbi:hypothetical protein [Pseudomonas mosselii]|uniref:hypothetical protein n=1 Tax=Pseudomonas mosselii TaxID=78327 RepID=UPI0021DB57D7|nr:hypothetical protein [Pseudomonas mosselii]MCU9529345.1 hypothetical protein [Pseudomonas mosselii]MCU9536636.1 hypothetical protein [Pseudomonas mosselii]MCU9542256.1 hypothetical protein [Pseudomonas mosselii]MCU9548361.1 hypothetical protein [Pseudomonas mosselii]
MTTDCKHPPASSHITGILIYAALFCGLSLTLGTMVPSSISGYMSHCWILVAVMAGNTWRRTLSAAFAGKIMGVTGMGIGIAISAAYFILAKKLFGAMDLVQGFANSTQASIVLAAAAIVWSSHTIAHLFAKRLFVKELANWT